jgi:hypothetical protein
MLVRSGGDVLGKNASVIGAGMAKHAQRGLTLGLAAAVVALAGSFGGVARAEPVAAPTVATPSAGPQTAGEQLDALLGLSSAPATTSTTKTDAQRDKLDTLLTRTEDAPEDELTAAVALMNQSAKRLHGQQDAGVDTQRVQEETLRKLDALIAKARKQSQSQCSNSSCDNPESKNQEQQQQQQQQAQSQPKESQASMQERRAQGAADKQAAEAPRAVDPSLRPALESARAAWGNLPARLRQSLMQGAGDTFSREYQRMTEEYYKRLGEQAE